MKLKEATLALALLTGCQAAKESPEEKPCYPEIVSKVKELRQRFVQVCTDSDTDEIRKDLALGKIVDERKALDVPWDCREEWRCSDELVKGPKPPYVRDRAFVSFYDPDSREARAAEKREAWRRICEDGSLKLLERNVWAKNLQCPEDK